MNLKPLFSPRRFVRLVSILVLLAALALGVTAAIPTQTAAQAAPDLLQIQSGGHALGFAGNRMVVSSGTYAQRVEAAGSPAVSYEAGEIWESAPLAWQVIEGR